MGIFAEIINTVANMVSQLVRIEVNTAIRIIKSILSWFAWMQLAVLVTFLGIVFVVCGIFWLIESSVGSGFAGLILGAVVILTGIVIMTITSVSHKQR